VLDHLTPLDEALETDAAFARLDQRDRALARAMVGTALRRHGSISAAITRLIAKPPARRAGGLMRVLEIAAAQILFMAVPHHASVSIALNQLDADRTARHFKGLANAVLRRMVREHDAILAAVDGPETNTPDWLWRRWVANYGEETARGIATAHMIEPSLDLSVQSDPEGWAGRLGGIVLPTGTVRVVGSGRIEDMPGFADGAWWVQDAAAALPPKLLGDIRGLDVADLCAAPGGKSAALAAGGARVTAVDISTDRLGRVEANLRRLGLAAEIVVADILTWQPRRRFDGVLLDAPCTATGTIRRHPDVAWLKKPGDVACLAELQTVMIDRAVALLKPGGTLVYCTCSLEPEEGEAQLAAVTARHAVDLVPVSTAELGGMAEAVTAKGTVRTLPCHLANPDPRLSGLDGFFMVRLRKARNVQFAEHPS
jgi:16S rRNA (cytosine967-C5)-methyltransferase